MKRKLAFLLALCLMLTMLPMSGLAEGIDIEPEVPEAAVAELIGESEYAIEDMAPIEEAAGIEPMRETEEIALDEYVSMDGPVELSEGDAWTGFTGGYLRVTEANNKVYDGNGGIQVENLPVDAILYASVAPVDGRIQVAYGEANQVAYGWMDAAVLCVVGEDELSALMDGWIANENAIRFDDEHLLPLLMLSPAYGAEMEEEPVLLDDALDAENARILPVPDAIELDKETVTIGRGEVLTIGVDRKLANGTEKKYDVKVKLGTDSSREYDTSLTFTNKSKAVEINENTGEITGKKRGTATITVTTVNGLTATCKVVVKEAPTKITVSPSKATIKIGETKQLTAAFGSTAEAGAVKWSSSDADVAKVDPDTGLVKAVGVGTATITARTYVKNLKATAKITVKTDKDQLILDTTSLCIGEGQTVTITAKMKSNSAAVFTFTSGNKKKAKVSASTKTKTKLVKCDVTGVAAGTTKITVKAGNYSATCKVTVKKAPTKITSGFTNNKVSIVYGQKIVLKPNVGGCEIGLTYEPKEDNIVSIKDGVLEGIGVGTTKVTLTTYNQKKATFTVTVKETPSKIKFKNDLLNIGVGEQLKASVEINKGSAYVDVVSSDPSIATIDNDTFIVTGKKPGSTKLTATTYSWDKRAYITASCKVKVYPLPTSITVNTSALDMTVGESVPLEAKLSVGSRSKITYWSDNTSVAEVSQDGVVEARGKGTAIITASTVVEDVYAEVAVTVWAQPTSVTLEKTQITLDVGDTYQMVPVIPNNTRTGFTYHSSNESVADVDEKGLVRALKKGTATITVTTDNDKSAKLNVTVSDSDYPEKIVQVGTVPTLSVGQSCVVQYRIEPEGANDELAWGSSNTKVAIVDSEGEIFAISEGTATITAVSMKNESCKLTIKVKVQKSGGSIDPVDPGDDEPDYSSLALEIPKRITGTSEIDENLAKIDAIRKSALAEVNRLANNKVITSSDATKRRSMINEIFKCYSFPWMTLNYQDYWKAKNSENGVKDFKPGNVYYGLPYISGSGKNRQYNVSLALSENRYYSSGKGYYILNQKKYLNGKYVGNDCSGLVDVAIWGTGSKYSGYRTDDIASKSIYRTIKDYGAMRPGDLLCLSDHHVVMFLYYVNSSKTNIMIIENGGEEAGTNTVHCAIHDLSYYTGKKYKVRRLAELG